MDDALQICLHLPRRQSPQPIVGAERENQQPHIPFERPVRAAQSIGSRVARYTGVDDLERDSGVVQLALQHRRIRLISRDAEPGSEAVAECHDTGCGRVRQVQRVHMECVGCGRCGSAAVQRVRDARICRTKSPQAPRGKGERDSILSILPSTSYTPVRGHHRLSAGVGARASGFGARPPCRRDRHPHAGAEVVRAQARRRDRPALHARRGLADG